MNAAAMRYTLLSAGMLCWGCFASAQSAQSPNTLKLDHADKRPQATLADLRPLVGHWRGDFLGGVGEEVWLPPAGGAMVGVFRLYRQDEVVFYELMTAVEEQGSVSLKLKHFHPDLRGWEGKDDNVTFRLVRAEPDAVWFEGLTYRRLPDGSLRGFIVIESKDGSAREESFTLKPVRER